MIPYLRKETLKNYTLSGGTYIPSPRMKLIPHPNPGSRGYTILGDPGAVSRVGRKGATKVFKYGRKSPWVPTLIELFPKIQADTGSWLGTKNVLYYCAQSANSSPEFFSWVRTRRLLSCHTCLVRSPSLCEQGELSFSTFLTKNEKTFGMLSDGAI